MGLSHLTLVPFAFQRGITSTDLRFRPDARWYTESDRGIRALADSARARGMRVILKPHIWVGRGSGDDEWRSNINFESDADWATWEAAYRSYIMHHAELAEQIDADIFVVGTELMTPATRREVFWRELIAEVRAVFSGRVTYAANWWREYAEIKFWDELDFIGVQAYFPLGTDDRATVDQLRDGWQPHLAEMHRLSNSVGKPVLFTEIGYRSFTGATERPWEWPSREQAETGNADDAVQAALYDAFFRTVWEQEWFAGAILWRWYSEEESGGSTQRIGFTPQNKPAKEVIRNWFRADALLETGSR